VDAAVWLALFAIAIGWFWMATLVGTFGPVRQIMHFYDFASVLHDPTWLVHGIRPAHSIAVLAFGALSVLVLLAPLGAHRVGTRHAWLLYAAPLALMLLSGIALYVKTSQPFFAVKPGAGSLGALFAQVSNGMIGRASDTISRHITVGAGGYLAFVAAGYLTWKGARGYHAALLHRQAVR
jgi:hypothetical protein